MLSLIGLTEIGAVTLKRDRTAPGLARQEMARLLGDGHSVMDVLALVVSELVTNSVRHADSGSGRGWVTVQLDEGFGYLQVTVTDPGALFSAPHRIPFQARGSAAMAEDGRGLSLVNELTQGMWGSRLLPLSGHRAVWCLLDLESIG